MTRSLCRSDRAETRLSFYSAAVAVILLALLSIGTLSCNEKVTNPDCRCDLSKISRHVSRGEWFPASIPCQIDTLEARKGQIVWFNPHERYPLKEICDTCCVDADVYTDILVLRFIPQQDNLSLSYGGIMRGLRDPHSYDTAAIQSIDLVLRGISGRLHVDIGEISEDLNGDQLLNREDVNANGILDAGEDVGLDGLPDSLERAECQCGLSDPRGDDWSYDPDRPYDYEHINGTEGNGLDSLARRDGDSEDVEFDGVLTDRDNYYSYTLDLSEAANSKNGSVNSHGWYKLHLSLTDSSQYEVVGSPDLNRWGVILRIWVDGVSSTAAYVEIADMVKNE